MQVTALIDNALSPSLPALSREWALSMHIQWSGGSLLFDTGQKGAFADNARALGIDISTIDTVVLSHGHFDHGGGLLRFFDANTNAPVFTRREVEETPLYARVLGFPIYAGLDPRVFGEHRSRMRLVEGNTESLPGLHLVTRIGNAHPRPRFNSILYRKEEGRFVPDDFRHELVTAIEEEDGLVVFTGCSHHGVIDMVEAVKTALPGKRIKGLVGGFHLAGLPPFDFKGEKAASIDRLAHELEALEIPRIVTGHCTGKRPFEALHAKLGDRIRYLATGERITL